MPLFKNVIFDLDGTLVDTLADLHYSLNRTLEHYGFPTLPLEETRDGVGFGLNHLLYTGIKRALAKDPRESVNAENWIEENIMEARLYFKEKSRTAPRGIALPYDGVYEGLKKIKAAEVRTALFAEQNEKIARKMVCGYKLDIFFDNIIGDDTFEFRKPHGIAWKRLSETLGYTKNDTLIVGDGLADYELAKRSGCALCLCRYGITPAEEILKWEARYYADSFNDVVNIILGIGGSS